MSPLTEKQLAWVPHTPEQRARLVDFMEMHPDEALTQVHELAQAALDFPVDLNHVLAAFAWVVLGDHGLQGLLTEEEFNETCRERVE